ncbi:Serine/Threonine kinase domain protein (macronuclear) [Tetrahymena thermophila SB210]|uniref:non-specific serine/threonine protein kinase n=1 Tax=Tetrahymena thermophila (strain SB210) TaxID=312017 RepID=I7M5Z9_TETTS|nr:Serine/Threonine kinase domain protein [Tetrahymena thermophila SB210]EAR83938.2 Serine/Threonine kinase domain protein [Tetrahymena thermophila SB210]|eukprot:XP_001031601.2 Serine/Threonine kinase domain protein [Tetrahymena thermophila SB210]
MNSPGFQNQISPNLRNFKELYHFKYQEKQLQSPTSQQGYQNLQSSQIISPTSSMNQMSKDSLLHSSQIMNKASPTAVKFPSFSTSQKQKLFLSNTNVIPKKVQSKAKMIQLNLQNTTQNQTQVHQSARNVDSTNISHSSQQNLHHNQSIQNSSIQQFGNSVNISRHQSFQQAAPSPQNVQLQGFLSKQSSQSNLNSSQLQHQAAFSATRSKGSVGSFVGTFNNSNENSQNVEQKKYEQYQLLQKYKNTPFLNYMQLSQANSPHLSQSQNFMMMKEIQQNYQQSLGHSRNPSQNQLQQTPQYERKQSSRLENKSSIMSPTNQSQIQNSNTNQTNYDNFKLDSTITRWSHQNMNKNQFTYQYVIGKGGFGKVWRVEHKKNQKPYAMKEMSKSKIITKRSVNSVMSERHLLSQLKNPFLVNMNYAFQDRDNLYLVMDLVSGGDLRFHIGRHRRFRENQTRFFVACIMVALEYLHTRNVIHRDIKPENLVLDTDGYVKVTDLGVARVWKPENSQDTSGTPGYMAPEVMCRQNHGIAVDYFAVGVIAYEFMMGRRPYLGRNRKEIRDQILAKQVQIKKHEIPDGWSIEAADFINRMIQRKPMNRLGVNGPEEVKQHPWLKNFPWEKLLNRQIDAPFVPQAIEENYEYRQQISADGEDTNEELIQQNAILLRKNSVQNLFAGYNYDINENQRQQQQLQQQQSQGQNQTLQQTGSTHSTNNTNIPSDRSQSALAHHASPTAQSQRKTPIQYA